MKSLKSPLFGRLLAFVAIFVLLSGLIGPRIVGGGILGLYHFDIYGGAGKALLFATVAFAVIAYRKPRVTIERWQLRNITWMVLAVLSFTVAWIGVSQLLAGVPGAFWPLLTHLALIGSIGLAAIGCFGLGELRRLSAVYRRELLISLALALAFYAFLLAVYSLWTILASAVLHSVRWLLELNGLTVAVVPPRTLLLDRFGIDIAQYCSGIESIALFTGLYAFIGILDWHRFDKRKFLLLFPAALLVLFSFNILRVYLLILAGYYINPQIAFSLFHTYAGMLFFILYSGIFWAVSYKWMLRTK